MLVELPMSWMCNEEVGERKLGYKWRPGGEFTFIHQAERVGVMSNPIRSHQVDDDWTIGIAYLSPRTSWALEAGERVVGDCSKINEA
jgi:hypothetical protein